MSDNGVTSEMIAMCKSLKINTPYYLEKIKHCPCLSCELFLITHVGVLEGKLKSLPKVSFNERDTIKRLVGIIQEAIKNMDKVNGKITPPISGLYFNNQTQKWEKYATNP
jgi:hypothetical protein